MLLNLVRAEVVRLSQSKVIHNDTNRKISLTIFIGGRNPGAVEAYGTRKLELEPEQSEEVSYGDVLHPFIEGMEIKRQLDGVESSHRIMINGENSRFDRVINEAELISLSAVEAAFKE